MSSHSHSSSSTTMEMIFFQSTSSPLFSKAWTPSSTGAYAGTCIFLVLLAIISRALSAGKILLERKWSDKELNRRFVTVRGQPRAEQLVNENSDAKTGLLVTERGSEERVRIVKRHTRAFTPWRVSVDLPRAAYTTLTAGINYLL